MRVLISGASGLIGRALTEYLRGQGHEVVCLVRHGRQPKLGEIPWNPDEDELDPAWLSGADAVVHLAGENIASGRWTAARKARIRDSRVRGTALIARAICDCPRPPRVLFSASAVGYYGDRGTEELTEDSAPGRGFLADVCREWEAAAASVTQKDVRLILGRLGVVLTPKGGALAKMLPPFRMGVGGVLGSGRQFMSWIALDDAIAAIMYGLQNDHLRGPVNLVAPQPVTNRQFTAALGSALRRPAFLPMPGLMVRLMFGEMADHLLLASARVLPRRLLDAGYAFRWPDLSAALTHMLSAPTAR